MTTPQVPASGTRRFDSPQQEAFLNLWRTYDRLRQIEDELFGRFDLTPVMQAFVDHDAQQCGFCTPGFVVATTHFL